MRLPDETPTSRRDEAMGFLLASYRPRMTSGLASGWPCVIWVEPARVVEAAVESGQWVLLDLEDFPIARIAWDGREDPHGWSPSETRTVAVIVPRV